MQRKPSVLSAEYSCEEIAINLFHPRLPGTSRDLPSKSLRKRHRFRCKTNCFPCFSFGEQTNFLIVMAASSVERIVSPPGAMISRMACARARVDYNDD